MPGRRRRQLEQRTFAVGLEVGELRGGLGELRDYFDDFWSEALAAFKAMAEDERRTA